jgi:hypothetical protein
MIIPSQKNRRRSEKMRYHLCSLCERRTENQNGIGLSGSEKDVRDSLIAL